MITCPFCAAKNEDGTLFCERCKSDLLNTPEAKAMSESLEAAPETLPVSEVPMAEPVITDAALLSDTEQHSPLGASTVEQQAIGEAAAAAPPNAIPKLVVIRGQKIDTEYTIYTGENYLGRTDEKPVDIDLEDQEAEDRIWCSRQHAKIVFDQAGMTLEDLGSQNGTFVNRARIYPGQLRPLAHGDVIQVGTVQMRVLWA